MPELICPVCGGTLFKSEKALRCALGHSYDLARQGYVNLLMSGASSKKRHGDDREMVAARSAFLEKGYYLPLRRALTAALLKSCGEEISLLDAGCGEGWYTAGITAELAALGRRVEALGVDISKEALKSAARRGSMSLAVASVSSLPVRSGSCTAVLSVFAPVSEAEFRRVLSPGGVVVRAVPLREHLMGLKRAVYDKPYPNPDPSWEPEGFRLEEFSELRYTISLTGREEIKSLFMMTPYYYKTGRADQQKLESIETLETEAAFGIYTARAE